MMKEKWFMVGYVKVMFVDFDVEFLLFMCEEIKVNKVSEKCNVVDRKKWEDVVFLCVEVEILKVCGMLI